MAAQALEAVGLEPVRLARPAQVLPQLRPLALPAADADVRVVALRKDPGVTAGDVGELEHEPAGVALARQRRVGDVPLVRDAVGDAVAEADRPRGDPVRAVGADDHLGPHLLARPERRQCYRARATPSRLRAPPPRAREPRRAGTRRAAGAASSRPPARWRGGRPPRRSGTAARPGRPAPRRPASGRPGTAAPRASSSRRRTACRAGSVALSTRSTEAPCVGQAVRGRRSGRSASDDDRVVVLHGRRLQCHAFPGGVPERPKGTGCKPVGSAYGGSNPPAPTQIMPESHRGRDPGTSSRRESRR